MIESTFILLQGIGESAERRLWESGVGDWYAFLDRPALDGISQARKREYDRDLSAAAEQLHDGCARYFARRLKPRDHWRLFGAFKSRAVYLDIETTGGPPNRGAVTVVGLYANGQMTSLVQGDTLTAARLAEELSRYDLLVTFFGSVFDLRYLQAKYPDLVLDHPHFDLCFASRRLGLRGGLKRVEAAVGIHRPAAVQGLDGWEAVRLWQAWRQGETRALELLLQYNEADSRNLEPLADLVYAGLVAQYRSGNRDWGEGQEARGR